MSAPFSCSFFNTVLIKPRILVAGPSWCFLWFMWCYLWQKKIWRLRPLWWSVSWRSSGNLPGSVVDAIVSSSSETSIVDWRQQMQERAWQSLIWRSQPADGIGRCGASDEQARRFRVPTAPSRTPEQGWRIPSRFWCCLHFDKWEYGMALPKKLRVRGLQGIADGAETQMCKQTGELDRFKYLFRCISWLQQ